jgi:hypothetical protein
MNSQIHDRLRESLTREANAAPSLSLTAGGIIQKGRRRRRIKRVAGVATAVVAVLAVTAGSLLAGNFVGGQRKPPAPAASGKAVGAGQPQVAILDSRGIHVPGDRTIPLPKPKYGGEWAAIEPVTTGWVIGNSLDVELVRPDGTTKTLATENPAGRRIGVDVLASPDGRQVALSTTSDQGAGRVQVFDVATGSVTASTASGSDVAYHWFKNKIVLRKVDLQADVQDPTPVSLWDPAAGPWDQKLTTASLGLFGATADGTRMVGYTTTSSSLCVGLVDPTNNFAMSAKTCSSKREDIVNSTMSPDRTRLVLKVLTNNSESRRIMRVTSHGLVLEHELHNPTNIDDNVAVWETNNLVDLFALESDPNSNPVRILQCRADNGTCREVAGGYSAVGYKVIANLTPPS